MMMKIKMKIKIKSKFFTYAHPENEFSPAEFQYITAIFRKNEKQDKFIPAFQQLPFAS